MVKLVCALAVDLSHPFSIDLPETSDVYDIKPAVKQYIQDAIKRPLATPNLELFRAKRNGKWLTIAETKMLNPNALGLENVWDVTRVLKNSGLGDRDVLAPGGDIETNVVHVIVDELH
ncbi:hypothetical protein ON010_g3261 [Phytophthora cinnamomi]|nr:hypothetical protein ON010_g3261 [Phytophthora cinnamomi]